jgi:hypothetical protein
MGERNEAEEISGWRHRPGLSPRRRPAREVRRTMMRMGKVRRHASMRVSGGPYLSFVLTPLFISFFKSLFQYLFDLCDSIEVKPLPGLFRAV